MHPGEHLLGLLLFILNKDLQDVPQDQDAFDVLVIIIGSVHLFVFIARRRWWEASGYAM